jgi:hypothetical protein
MKKQVHQQYQSRLTASSGFNNCVHEVRLRASNATPQDEVRKKQLPAQQYGRAHVLLCSDRVNLQQIKHDAICYTMLGSNAIHG